MAPKASAIEKQGLSDAVAARIEAPQRGSINPSGGIAPGNRLLATDHGLTGFPDLKANPGLGL